MHGGWSNWWAAGHNVHNLMNQSLREPSMFIICRGLTDNLMVIIDLWDFLYERHYKEGLVKAALESVVGVRFI